MNTAQINMNPETQLSDTNEWWMTTTNHRYNLSPQPTKQNKKYIMTQDGQQSANKKLAKTHLNVMMM